MHSSEFGNKAIATIKKKLAATLIQSDVEVTELDAEWTLLKSLVYKRYLILSVKLAVNIVLQARQLLSLKELFPINHFVIPCRLWSVQTHTDTQSPTCLPYYICQMGVEFTEPVCLIIK